MTIAEAPPALAKQFALVSYIPDPLGSFLDTLRLELVPNCSPHAHVTVLPPRPIHGCPEDAAGEIERLSHPFSEFEVELGDMEMFPQSRVIYIGLRRGAEELHKLYESLNRGAVDYCERYPYHPHITIVQNVDPEFVPAMFDRAVRRWSEYTGPRTFAVKSLDFVKNLQGTCWKDLASIELNHN